MKTVLISLCVFLLLFSCDTVEPPTGACKWGPLKQNCSDGMTYEDCRKTFNGDWFEGEDCP